MKILFLDQSGQMGGAELCLADLAQYNCDRSLVLLFTDGPFQAHLQDRQIPVQVLAGNPLQVCKESGLRQGLVSLGTLVPMIRQVAQIAPNYGLLYANTQKALVVGAFASLLSRRPLVFHLHDILSPDHFSRINRRLAVTLANRFATQVIANSETTRQAFGDAGGDLERTVVVYNGFDPQVYQNLQLSREQWRQDLGLGDRFVVGHFSRLAPWKGQHILIEALQDCSEDIHVLLVGEALFGEQAYRDQLHQQVKTAGLSNRVHWLGFRADIPQLMAVCDLVVHTSTAPEPFGRVVVEAMLSGRPVIAAAAGGVTELIEHGQTGWLSPPADPHALAARIMTCRNQPDQAIPIAYRAQRQARQRFDLSIINQQITHILQHVITTP